MPIREHYGKVSNLIASSVYLCITRQKYKPTKVNACFFLHCIFHSKGYISDATEVLFGNLECYVNLVIFPVNAETAQCFSVLESILYSIKRIEDFVPNENVIPLNAVVFLRCEFFLQEIEAGNCLQESHLGLKIRRVRGHCVQDRFGLSNTIFLFSFPTIVKIQRDLPIRIRLRKIIIKIQCTNLTK